MWALDLGLLQEQQAPLTTEASLLPPRVMGRKGLQIGRMNGLTVTIHTNQQLGKAPPTRNQLELAGG